MASLHDPQLNPFRIDEDRRERPERPLKGFPEDSWGGTLRRELDNAMSHWGRGAGALFEQLGSGDRRYQQELVQAAQTLQNDGDASQSRSVISRTFNGPIARFLREKAANIKLHMAAGTGDIPPAASEAVQRGDWQAAEHLIEQNGVRRGLFAPIEDTLASVGENMQRHYSEQLITNQPNVAPGTLKSVVGNTIEHGLGTLLPMAATAATTMTLRRPLPGTGMARLFPNAAPPDLSALPSLADAPTPQGAPAAQTSGGAPYPDGTRLRKGGQLYVVRHGTPVPLENANGD